MPCSMKCDENIEFSTNGGKGTLSSEVAGTCEASSSVRLTKHLLNIL